MAGELTTLGLAMGMGIVDFSIVPSVISIFSGGGYAGSVYRTSITGGQWFADGVAIPGETAQDWVMTLAYEGSAITYRIGSLISNAIEMYNPAMDMPGVVAVMDIRQGITQAGGLVSAWASTVGGKSAVQGTGSSQPTYDATSLNGAPSLFFSGGNRRMGGLDITASPPTRSFAGLAMFSNFSAIRTIYGGILGGMTYRAASTGVLGVTSQGIAQRAADGSPLTAATPYVLSHKFTQSGPFEFKRNGVSSATGTATGGQDGVGNITIGSDTDTGPMIGYISSMAFSNSYLDDTQMNWVEGWVAWTLGQQGLLDASHPFKSVAPRLQ